MQKGFPLLLLFLSLAAFVSAQDSTVSLSVTEAVEYANKNSMQVRNSLLGIELQRQQNR